MAALRYWVTFGYQLNDEQQSQPAHYFSSTKDESDRSFTYECAPDEFTPEERLHLALGGEITSLFPQIGDNAGQEVYRSFL